MSIRPMFAWYNFWIGVFIDTRRKGTRIIYVFPIPMFGLRIELGGRR